MAKELSVKDWQERIKLGQRFQMEFADSKSWNRYRNYYRHRFQQPKGIIPVNLYYPLLRSIVPQVTFRNPSITITPRKPGLEYEIFARILQSIDQWLLKELVIKNQLRYLVQDNFFCGIGNGIFGYDSLFGASPEVSLTGATFTQTDASGHPIEFNQNARQGMPWFLRARPEDVIWPYGASGKDSSEWFALRVFRPLSDIKADSKYKNTNGLQGTHQKMRTGPEGQEYNDVDATAPTNEYNEQYVELWEVHDARTGNVYVTVMDHDKFLRADEDIAQIDGLGSETLTFNSDSDYIYGIPDGRIIEAQQLELNEIRTQAMKHRRLDLIKLLVKKGVIAEEEIQKMTDETVASVIEAASVDGRSIKDAVQALNFGASGIMQDMAFAGELVRQDVREMVGFSRTAQGEFQGKTHVSAAETNQVMRALNIRLDERREMVADLLTNVIRKFNQMIFKNWSNKDVAKIVGPDGAQYWIEFSGTEIKGEYDMQVSPEEGLNLDTPTKFDMGVRAAEVWAKLNAGAIAQGQPVPAEIQRLIFNPFTSLGLDIDRLLAQTAPTPAQSQLGQAGTSRQTPASIDQLAAALGPA